jgi:RHS repeat-associated protein
VNFQYDLDGLLTQAGLLNLSRDSQNGLLTGMALGNITDALGYNGFGEVAVYQAAYSGAGIFSDNYTRDDLGRIIQKNETIDGATHTYAYMYDQAGRLTNVSEDGVMVSQYIYDANGNRLSYTSLSGTISGSYDNQDRLLQYGTTTYNYTANGELLNKTNGSQTTTYQYDVLGNLRNVTLPDGTKIEYLIDGQNRRIGKKVNGVLVQGFLYEDGLRPIAELDGTGNVVSRFVYAGVSNVPAYMVRGNVTYRIVADHLGSPRLIVAASKGSVVQRIDYDEFGKIVMDSNPGFQPFGFASGIYDRDTGLMRFGARDYDAEVGRWTAKDPILYFGGDVNLYGYVSNDPITFFDPAGLQPQMALIDPNQAKNKAEIANDKAILAAAEKYTSPDDTFTIFLHGAPDVAFDKDRTVLKPEDLAKKIKFNNEFTNRKYTTIRLAGCKVGKKYAEKLAKELERYGVKYVEYSDDNVYFNSENGKLIKSYGSKEEIKFSKATAPEE